MEQEKILENITKSISERLKVPIILTYVCVLVVYNWDILYYLFFESLSATSKIQYIKITYGEIYYKRLFYCLIFAIILIIIFTVLNTAINFCLKWFYRKDKQITSEIESYEQINTLTGQLSESIEKIKKLNTQIENLKNVNQNLNSKNLNLDISKISENDYNNLLAALSNKPNKDKLLYSLKELITQLRNDIKVDIELVHKNATYTHDMHELLNILANRKLAYKKLFFDVDRGRYNGLELGPSFKDFLKMET